jgi:hypothetical protein
MMCWLDGCGSRNVRALVFQLVRVQCPDSVAFCRSGVVKSYAEYSRVELLSLRFVKTALRVVNLGYRNNHSMG